MTCHLCQRIRDFFVGRAPCETCERTSRAFEAHERSTARLTRVALDQVDMNAGLALRTGLSASHVAMVAEDALQAHSFGGTGEREG